MLYKFILLLIGIFLCSYSIMFIIVYANIIYMDYTFVEYLLYLVKHFECYLWILGIILIMVVLKEIK